MYGSLLSSCTAFTLCTLLDPLYLLEPNSITSSLSISICCDHSKAIPLFTPSITLGLPSYHKVIRLTLKWMKSQYHLGFILLDNRIIIDYVANRNYILTVFIDLTKAFEKISPSSLLRLTWMNT